MIKQIDKRRPSSLSAACEVEGRGRGEEGGGGAEDGSRAEAGR